MSDKDSPPAAPASPESRAEAGATQREGDGRFPKGVSGNPGGRPASSRQFKDLARSFSSFALKRLVEIARVSNGAAGVRACELILERAWGRVPMEVSGPGGKAIDLRFGGAARNALEEAIAAAAAQEADAEPPSEN